MSAPITLLNTLLEILFHTITQEREIICIQRGFPGGPVFRTLHSHCPGPGFNPWPHKTHSMAKKKKKHTKQEGNTKLCLFIENMVLYEENPKKLMENK